MSKSGFELAEFCHYNTEHLSGMHPSLVPDCNNDCITQSGLIERIPIQTCVDETAAINSRD